jgi:hypothetical protein
MKRVSDKQVRLALQLIYRLERLSVDSHWAHRAAGIKGALLKSLESIEAGEDIGAEQLPALIKLGFEVLERAAWEVG